MHFLPEIWNASGFGICGEKDSKFVQFMEAQVLE